jgi:hypothetical protein
MCEKKIYTVRDKDGTVVCILDDPFVLVEEICMVCKKQGIIWRVHDLSEPHRGSPFFKPWEITAPLLRKMADLLEKKHAAQHRKAS